VIDVASFGSAPHELLSSVCARLREKHPELAPETLVGLVMASIITDAKRQVSEKTFVESFLLHHSAANGDGFVRVVPGWADG